jgi:gliding motility-associated-like protein
VITSNYNGQNISCNGLNDGSANLTVTGGWGSYNYSWSNGATTQDISNVGAGTYIVTIIDTNNCSLKDTITLTQPPALTNTATIVNVDCNGFATGSIDVTPAGGTPGYVYTWSNGNTTQDVSGLTSGVYVITITDTNGCSIIDSNTVIQNTAVLLTSDAGDVKCHNETNGYVDITLSGGVAPYTYSWSNGNTAQDAYGLAAGTYVVITTDSKGCTRSDTFAIMQPNPLLGSLVPSIYPNGFNVSLFDMNDGSVDLTLTGGTPPYNVTWSNGTTNEDLANVPAGMYSVLIVDSNGCVFVASIKLDQPFDLALPSGFTPNGDGYNDLFIIHGIESYPDNKLEIYNRWGNIVYDKNLYGNDWNGTNNSGEALPAGTYFVVFVINDNGNKIELKGYVDIRR